MGPAPGAVHGPAAPTAGGELGAGPLGHHRRLPAGRAAGRDGLPLPVPAAPARSGLTEDFWGRGGGGRRRRGPPPPAGPGASAAAGGGGPAGEGVPGAVGALGPVPRRPGVCDAIKPFAFGTAPCLLPPRGGGEGEQHTPAVARRGLPGRSGSLPPPPRPARRGPAPPRGLPGAARCPLGTGHHGGPCPLGLCPPAPAPAASACPAARRARHPLSPPPAGSAGPGSGPGPAAGAGKARDGRGAAGGPGAARCWPVSCRCRGRPGRRAAASPSCRP